MARASKDSRAGRVINARYELRELIAAGAVSDAYRADDRRQNKSVQVTLLRPEFALQAGVVQRFLLAGKVLAGMQHANVSRVIAVESDDTGIPFVVEELVEGESLAKTIAGHANGMPLDAAVDLVMPVLEVLCALHGRGLWHGQLDSDHVMLAKAGARSSPKLVGFAGIAKAAPRAAARTRSAPEQRDGKGGGDARADVWSVGALLHETLCGVAPGEAGADGALLRKRAPHLPEPIVALVRSCLSPDPAQRPSRVEDVRLALVAACKPPEPKVVPAKVVAAKVVAAKPPEPQPVAPTPVAPKPIAPKLIPPKQTAPKPIPTELAETQPDPELSFALGATMFQQPAPRVPAASPASAASAPPDASTRELRAAAKVSSKPPRRSAEVEPPPLPAAPVAKVRTLEDIASAFGPIEGAERIVQSESNDASRAREFRNAMEVQAEAESKKRPRRRDDSGAHVTAGAARDDNRGPSGVLLSRKQLREGGSQPRALSQEEMRHVRERLLTAEPRRWRAFGDGLLLAFALLLIWFMPLLGDASHTRAQTAFGASAPHVLSAFAIIAIVTLVRTWTLNAQLRPMMLGPATFALQIVVVCACVLCAGFFFPNGALGAADSAARWMMPWAAGGFYMFMGMYGVMRGVRDSSSNLIAGMLVALLYSGGFYGSYRAVAYGVVEARSRGGFGFSLARARKTSDMMQKVANGEAQQAADAADAGMRVEERHEIGASEEDDMRAVDQLRKRDPKLGQLQKKVQEVTQEAPEPESPEPSE